jgi:hypothetical protein
MRGDPKSNLLVIVVILLLILVADPLLRSPTPFYETASAYTREYEWDITIPADDFQALELSFRKGDELEFIFSLDVKEDLPIDIWFVNYANYVRMVDGHDFLFYIDGSGQDIKQVQKVVTVTQHDSYRLVLANYNNESVNVYLTYDINIYPQEETPLWKEPFVILPLGLLIGILVGFFAFRMVERLKKGTPKTVAKTPLKEAKAKKVKKAKAEATKVTKTPKPEKEEPKVMKKEPSKKTVEPTVVGKALIPSFCGNCGKPVQTRFCPYCGKEVQKV